MEEKKEIPTGINSFYVISELQTNHFDLNKKRKMPAEQLGLPLAKHKHCNKSFPSEYVFPNGGQPEAKRMDIPSIKVNTDGMCSDEGSEPESAKDSYSINEDSDSAASVLCEAKFEPDRVLTCTYDSSSIQSLSSGGVISKSTHYVQSSAAVESRSTRQDDAFAETGLPDHDDGLHTIHNLEDHLLELGNHEAYSCADYRTDGIDQCTDNELEELLYSNGLNPNVYVLSSGRWSVNQEAQSGTRNPTIDQEFEQYFSMLML